MFYYSCILLATLVALSVLVFFWIQKARLNRELKERHKAGWDRFIAKINEINGQLLDCLGSSYTTMLYEDPTGSDWKARIVISKIMYGSLFEVITINTMNCVSFDYKQYGVLLECPKAAGLTGDRCVDFDDLSLEEVFERIKLVGQS